jgi:hypothetical protein
VGHHSKSIFNGATTVLLSPDGAVARIPFGKLPGKTAGSYLLEEVNLAVVPLPRRLPLLLETVPNDTGDASLLLIGDVDYGAAPGKVENVAGLHRTFIGSVERGERNVAILNLRRIAKSLRVSLSDLFPGKSKNG